MKSRFNWKARRVLREDYWVSLDVARDESLGRARDKPLDETRDKRIPVSPLVLSVVEVFMSSGVRT